MIDHPADVYQLARWNGARPTAPTTNLVDWAEHRRIVCDAKRLMGERPAPGGDEPDRPAATAYAELCEAYHGNGVTLLVARAIGPGPRPHIQLVTHNARGEQHTFELAVAAEGNSGGLEPAPRRRWQPTRFTVVSRPARARRSA